MTMQAEVPKGWTRRRLRFDVQLNPQKSKLDIPADTEISFVPMEAVGELGGLQLSETRLLEEVYNGYTYFADGDVCLAKITPCFENGKGALAQGLTNGVGFGTTELHVLRPKPSIDQSFLFYLTIAHDFRSFGEAEMLGAGGQKRVPEDFIQDWRTPLPPLETQRRIARFLDDKTARIDGLIEKKHALLERLAEKRQALITRAVTKGLNPDAPMKPSGIDWLGDIPAHWEAKRLRFALVGGTANGLYKPKDQFAEDGTCFVQMGEAFKGVKFDGGTADRVQTTDAELKKWGLKSGDFLIARRSLVFEGSGKSVKIGDLPEPHLFESSMIRIRPTQPEKYSGFLSYFFQSPICRAFFLSITKQVTISGIDSQQLKDVTIPLPPPDEAAKVWSYCDALHTEIENVSNSVHTSMHKLREYRSALITAAVTGKMEIA